MQWVATLLANLKKQPLDERVINKIFKAVEKQQGKVSDIAWLSENEAVDIIFQGTKDVAWPVLLKEALKDACYDIVVQPHQENRRKSFLISDMDSTIIQQECIDELADVMGLKEKVSAITERAMNGELDFNASLRQRVGLLKDLPESELQRVLDERIVLMPGAKTLLATMKKYGATCVLVSGGFTFFTEQIKAQTGFDHTHANILNFENGVLTGEVTEPILDKDSKQEFLEDYQQKLQLTKDDIIAVGDGANDIPMLQAAGIGVAYHAKQHVKDLIGCAIDHHDLTALLFIQGYRREDFVLT